ncbi:MULTISPECIES: HAAS signaling domain-containing protein [unclassified Streptomyces]|uniref:HAAS signaling domain-containing protein n=1 Tax=unclassified Streptomyces TaxID=2593676 RepID=UPI00368B9B20
MNATEHPLAAAYLGSVAREAAALPPERRAELLADLREHIEVSGAGSDEEVRAVLNRLGDARTVAASALAEEPAARRVPDGARGRVRLTLGLLASAGLLVLLHPFLGTIALFAGLALLWNSPLWSTRQKLTGTVTAAAPPLLLVVGGLLGAASRIGPLELLVILVFSAGVPFAGATALRRATRP